MNSPSDRARPLHALEVPCTLHGLNRAERDAVQSRVENQLKHLAGNVELMNALMRFHDEAAAEPAWEGLRVGVNDDVVDVYVLWPVEPDEDEEDPGSAWLLMEAGTTGEDSLLDQAFQEGCEMDGDQAAMLIEAAAELFYVSAPCVEAIKASSNMLNQKGLTREQVARPASVVFPELSGSIQAWESAFDLEANLDKPKRSRPARARV